MSVRIRDKDRGYKRLTSRLRRNVRDKSVVDVGVLGEKGKAPHGGSETNVTVATRHEFGQGVPERSFIRAAIDQNKAVIRAMQRRLAKLVVRGKTTEKRALEILGLKIQRLIQAKIESNIRPPLSASTIAKKKSSIALIDSAQMINSLTFRVRKGGARLAL